ncbi:hypothetical protein LSH36_162g01056 [Paralvinella palmiformis]|uniref:J domain-containing protein n=1 Tax=Paralvinella palmiformis TaxID=53620 RepID=A0AAD9N8F2_9ANNE|nr:hypothetical protein LSH36_162g01056 [Paralvinella palmiformis]
MEKLLRCNRCLFLRCASCFNSHSSRCFHLASPVHRETHYDVLGVNKDATSHEIREAFVKLSKEVHPDLNPNDPSTHDKFVNINEAYNVLSKMSSRRRYDEMLQHPSGNGCAGATYYHGPGSNPASYYSETIYNSTGEGEHMEFYNIRGVDQRTNGRIGIIAVAAIMMGTLSFVIALLYSYKKRRDYDDQVYKQNLRLSEERKRYDRKFTTAEQLETFILKHQQMVTGLKDPNEQLRPDTKH